MRRIALIILVACAVLLAGCTVTGCGVLVPDVKGKTAEQAEADLAAAGFTPGKVTYDESANGAPGAVVGQTPAAGTTSKEGAVVNVTVAGPPPVTMPSLVGLGRDAAAAALTAVGLNLASVTESFVATVSVGTIFQQEPPSGAVLSRGAAVKVFISKGTEPARAPAHPPAVTVVHVKVPVLKGLALAAAKSKITAAGLKWKHILGPGDGMVDVGFVYKQAPASGTSVEKNTVVSIYTWQGP
jgi:beta-lactam-binding protein with PASTA domain